MIDRCRARIARARASSKGFTPSRHDVPVRRHCCVRSRSARCSSSQVGCSDNCAPSSRNSSIAIEPACCAVASTFMPPSIHTRPASLPRRCSASAIQSATLPSCSSLRRCTRANCAIDWPDLPSNHAARERTAGLSCFSIGERIESTAACSSSERSARAAVRSSASTSCSAMSAYSCSSFLIAGSSARSAPLPMRFSSSMRGCNCNGGSAGIDACFGASLPHPDNASDSANAQTIRGVIIRSPPCARRATCCARCPCRRTAE